MRKVYICGKVSGLQRSDVELKFNNAETLLKFNHYEPVNPIRFVKENTTWDKAMKICISKLMDCEYIYLLDDFTDSMGAWIEYDLSRRVNIKQLKKEYLCRI